MARATARTKRQRTEIPGWKARSRSRRVHACRSSRGTCSKRSARCECGRTCSWTSVSSRRRAPTRAATKTIGMNQTRSTISGLARSAGYAVVNLGARYQVTPRIGIASPDQQPVRSAVLDRRSARCQRIHGHGRLHRAAVSRSRRRVPAAPRHVRRPRRADRLLDRHPRHAVASAIEVRRRPTA